MNVNFPSMASWKAIHMELFIEEIVHLLIKWILLEMLPNWPHLSNNKTVFTLNAAHWSMASKNLFGPASDSL